MMAGRDSSLFAVSIQKGAIPVSAQPSPDAPAAAVQNMRLAFTSDGSAVYKPVAVTSPPTSYQPDGSSVIVIHQQGSLSAGLTGSGGQVKRKRGRPRKYGPDGSMALALTPVSSSLPSGYPPSSATRPTTPTITASGKKRGRPLGSGKKQQLAALGSPGIGFMPHVVTVKAGETEWKNSGPKNLKFLPLRSKNTEALLCMKVRRVPDVASKIMSFSQQGPRAVCILSANGAISNVTLRQPATSGGSVTYEGRFEILSLSGSFLLSESGGQRSRTGGLSVSLAGPDGQVLGGVVAGLLMAASPVQVIVGSFIAEGRKPEPKATDLPVPSKLTMVGAAAAASSPPSRGTLSESSGGGPGSPLNHSTGACNNSQPGNANMPWK